MILKLTIAIFFILGSGPKETDAVKLYAKDYYANGQLKSEGWSMGDMKVKYWKFYHSNGRVLVLLSRRWIFGTRRPL